MISCFCQTLQLFLTVCVVGALLMFVGGCDRETQEKTPQEIEKSRLEHGRAAQRELNDG